jgi:hypothetical protein
VYAEPLPLTQDEFRQRADAVADIARSLIGGYPTEYKYVQAGGYIVRWQHEEFD